MIGKILGVVAGVCALAVVAFFVTKKKGGSIDLSSVKTDTVDRELKYSDCLAWIKNKNLREGIEVPLVISESFFKAQTNSENVTKDGYQMLILAVFNNESETITDAVVIYAKSLDQKTNEVVEMAKNAPDGLVKLSNTNEVVNDAKNASKESVVLSR